MSDTDCHDPVKTLFNLRDHLARHDKPIAFLFGAGTSCAVKVEVPGRDAKPIIPAVAELTLACKDSVARLGDSFAQGWVAIEQCCRENDEDPNIESMLSRVRVMINAAGRSDRLSGLDKVQLAKIETSIRRTIARVVNPALDGLGSEFPHQRLASWLGRASRKNPVEIYTVNYDVLIEHALERERVAFFDGFVGAYQPFFHADSLRRPESAPGANWVRLWKMHGSITWRRVLTGGRSRIIRSQPDQEGEMILPSTLKYDESRQQPYVAFTDRLSRFLEQDDALLVVAGFSFGDEHINNIIFAALDNRPRTHVYALQYGEHEMDGDLGKRACQRANMIVLGPMTGIVARRRASWVGVDDSGPLSYVCQRADPSVDLPAQFQIGNFSVFCRFLESMVSS